MFSNIGAPEIIIIAIVLLILFGGKKLPEFGRGLGETIKEIRKSFKGGSDDSKE